jgi:hypothetical protein
MALRALCVLAHLLLVVALESAPPALAPLRQDPASPPAALKVRLGAPWPRSNATRLMESAEFLAQQSGPDAFWHLVTTGSLPLLDAHSALLLDLSLAVHVHALALEQQRVLQEALRAGLEFADAERCRGGAFAAIQSASQGTYGVCADGLDVVPAACAAGGGDRRKLLVLSSDHVHPRSSAAPDAPVVILHGELGPSACAAPVFVAAPWRCGGGGMGRVGLMCGRGRLAVAGRDAAAVLGRGGRDQAGGASGGTERGRRVVGRAGGLWGHAGREEVGGRQAGAHGVGG